MTAEGGARGQERILVVDDEPLVRRALRRVLQSLGYEVTEAGGGDEALAILRSRPDAFDLVLSDHAMPGLTGAELARVLRTELPGTPLVLCTGDSGGLDGPAALGAGVVQKPFERGALDAVLRRALASAPRR